MTKALNIDPLPKGGKILKPGIYDIPLPLYHSDIAWKESVSSGDLKLLSENGEEYFEESYYNPKNLDEKRQIALHKECFRFGTAAHCKILEPQKWIKDYEIRPKKWGTWRSSDSKYWRWHTEAKKGKTVITPEEVAHVDNMAERILDHTLASKLFELGVPEVSGFIEDDNGTVIKCRSDMSPLAPDGQGGYVIADNVFSDYKTIWDNSIGSCYKAIRDYGYDQKLANCAFVFCRLFGIPFGDLDFALVFQKTLPPYGITIVELDNEYMFKLVAKNLYGSQNFARGRAAIGGEWLGYVETQQEALLKYKPSSFFIDTLDKRIKEGVYPNLDGKLRRVKPGSAPLANQNAGPDSLDKFDSLAESGLEPLPKTEI